MVPPLSLTIEACRNAVTDAGLTFDDIDGLSTYPGLDVAGMGEGGVAALEGALGLHPTWINGGTDTFGPGGSVIAAMLAVGSGMCRHVLCFRTFWQSTFGELPVGRRAVPPAGCPATNTSQIPYGATSAPHTLAIAAHRTSPGTAPTGDPRMDRAERPGERRPEPDRLYRDPMTMDDYLGARSDHLPFGLYDCDVPSTAPSLSWSPPATSPATCPTAGARRGDRHCRSSSAPTGTRPR